MLLQDEATRALLACLNQGGEEARIIGGAVRNALLGLAVQDVDIATTALPEEVMRRAASKGWKVAPTGLKHGTITVIIKGRPFEVTTLREDIATDGRHAVVRFGRNFMADALRRDFTMNALALDSEGQVHDTVGGMADLAARRLRFIGDATTRLREDYLRGLRFLRFSARYGEGRLDETGFAAVLAAKAGYASLSRERVKAELFKLFAAPFALPVMQAAADMLADIIGSPLALPRLAARRNIAMGDIHNPLFVLFALAVTDEASIKALRHSLRLANAEEAGLMRLLKAYEMAQAPGLSPRALGYLYPAEAEEALILAAASGRKDRLAAIPALGPAPVFLLTGKDALALGLRPGPELGAALEAAHARWLAAGLPEGEAAQQAILQAVIKPSG